MWQPSSVRSALHGVFAGRMYVLTMIIFFAAKQMTSSLLHNPRREDATCSAPLTQQRFQRANFSPLIHASLYWWRAALIHVLLSFFKLPTLSLPRTLYCTSSLSPQHIDVRPLRMKYNQAEKIIMGTISFLCFEKVNAIKFDETIFIN